MAAGAVFCFAGSLPLPFAAAGALAAALPLPVAGALVAAALPFAAAFAGAFFAGAFFAGAFLGGIRRAWRAVGASATAKCAAKLVCVVGSDVVGCFPPASTVSFPIEASAVEPPSATTATDEAVVV